MGLVSIKSKGDFKKTTKFLNFVSNDKYIENKLIKYGEQGVKALAAATPVDTGKTAASWDYEIIRNDSGINITWTNSNMAGKTGISVAVLIQTGHATRSGTYIKGIDFINPALRPIFDKIADEVWKEVVNA